MPAGKTICDPVRSFVLEYAASRGITAVADDEHLLKNNIIDSLGVFRMIGFLENTFPITIEDTDMVPENFQTIHEIGTFVAGKLGSDSASVETLPVAATQTVQ